MKITEFLKDNIICLDGSMGTLLQKRGLAPGELPERWNLTRPSDIIDIHTAYFNAGSHVVNTNTFGANCLKFSEQELFEIIKSAVENARAAQKKSTSAQPKWVALDIGPTGRMLKPYGDLDFEDAVEIFAKTVKIGADCGADLVFIETMNDSLETKAALLAAKENCNLPVFVSNAYGEDGKLMTGADPASMVFMLEAMGADAVGMNCSQGPGALAPICEEYLKYASVPVILKPNAGLPRVENGKTVYDVGAEEFADEVCALVKKGVRVAGGCCGTDEKYISALTEKLKDIKPLPIEKKEFTAVSSYTHAVIFDKKPVLIGERINPTGKKLFKEALKNKDIDYILKEGLTQAQKGAQILDVNVGLPEIDETEMLKTAVFRLQGVCDLPLQIDTSSAEAMESALRIYNGKAMINSVNGKKESMDAVFPLVKKYGGVVVALTLDESGIPETAEGRVEVAKKILKEAEAWGIDKKDIVFDPLALTVSADNRAAVETLKAVRLIESELNCKTSLGVSNVSFGLPQREAVNSAFFALAMENGLSAAIMNPYSNDMMKAYFAFCALKGFDENCKEYIEFAETLPQTAVVSTSAVKTEQISGGSELQSAVIKGLCESAAVATKELLKSKNPLDIIKEEIIPALDVVGKGFEEKTVYLPQLLMSAEAAKTAFEEIKNSMGGEKTADKCPFVLATVKGDIHDIGKNIVKLLLQNYGFNVIDLGRDVAPEEILKAVIENGAPICGLSALMTTTVGAMQDTITLLKEKAPYCKVVVGGAVLTREYANDIGADGYAKDAMEAVRYAEEIFKSL